MTAAEDHATSGHPASLVTDLGRFQADQALVEGLVDGQLSLWSGTLGDWIVLPIGANTSFSVVARDVEGERQAREIVRAFVGPGVATLTGPQLPGSDAEERTLTESGVTRVLGLEMLAGQRRALLQALEVLTAVRCSIDRVAAEPPAGPVNMLRDFRLALAQGDSRAAEERLDALQATVILSPENLRFLRVELLARFGRWPETVALPYFAELEQARRPRQVSELMLEALWHQEILSTGRPPAEAFRAGDSQNRHQALRGSVDVPRQRGARSLCYLGALEDGDEARVTRLLESATPADRAYLESLAWRPETVPDAHEDPVQEARRLLDRYQYAAVVDLFLEQRLAELADPAAEAALELGDLQAAIQVLEVLQELLARGLQPARRLSRDLDELQALVSGACGSWIEWIDRVAGEARWGEASAVARQSAPDWPPLPLSESTVGRASGLLISANDGVNGDQVRASLDLLCAVAAQAAQQPSQTALLDAVLLILSAQENIGGPVRNAFNDLVWVFLESGPTRAGYEGLIGAATLLWERIASPLSIDWVLELLDALISHPVAVPDSLTSLAAEAQARSTPFAARFSPRQASAMRSLLEGARLPGWPDVPPPDGEQDNIWEALNGADIGLYSLVAAAGVKLRTQLDLLCQVRSFTHRQDKVASAALRSLAQSADYLVVDTWHAAHAATACIDEVRPRPRQILPRRGGTPALVAAIEDALVAQAVDVS